MLVALRHLISQIWKNQKFKNFKVSRKNLPFVLDDGKTYDKKGLKEVWAQSGQSGLDKR